MYFNELPWCFSNINLVAHELISRLNVAPVLEMFKIAEKGVSEERGKIWK
jgi:hypothetical protein